MIGDPAAPDAAALDRRPRGLRPAQTLLALAAALALLAGWWAVHTSWIARPIDGRVEHVDRYFEKRPGLDDTWIVTVDGDPMVFDRVGGPRFRIGERIRKDRFERFVHTPRGAEPLGLSRNARGLLLTLPVTGAAIAVALFADRRRRPHDVGTPLRRRPPLQP